MSQTHHDLRRLVRGMNLNVLITLRRKRKIQPHLDRELACLQTLLNRVLSAFLNGFAVIPAVCTDIATLLFEIDPDSLETTGLADSWLTAAYRDDSSAVGACIGPSYDFLQAKALSINETGVSEMEAAGHFSSLQYTGDRMAPVRAIADVAMNQLQPFSLDFLFHGSLSDLSITEYSDVDVLSILRREALFDPVLGKVKATFEKVGHLSKQFDPLQHHGLFVLTEADLAFYPEAIFPSSLFAKSKSVLNADGFSFRRRASWAEEMFGLCGMLDNILHVDAHFLKGLFEVKLYLSWIMLLPSLYFQYVSGHGVYKSEAIAGLDAFVPADLRDILKRVSHIRESWSNDDPAIVPEVASPGFIRAVNALAAFLFQAAVQHRPLLHEVKRFLEPGAGSPPAVEQVNPPVRFDTQDYATVVEEVRSAFLDRRHEFAGLILSGNYTAPVPGFTDLDLIVVMRDDDPLTVRAYFETIAAIASPFARYIIWHEPVFLTVSEFNRVGSFWAPFEFVFRDENVADVSVPDDHVTAVRFLSGIRQLIYLSGLHQTEAIDLRTTMLRIVSSRHTVALLARLGLPLNEMNQTIDAFEMQRRHWFAQTHTERVRTLQAFVADAISLFTKCFCLAREAPMLTKLVVGHPRTEQQIAVNSVVFRFTDDPCRDEALPYRTVVFQPELFSVMTRIFSCTPGPSSTNPFVQYVNDVVSVIAAGERRVRSSETLQDGHPSRQA